MPGMTVPAWTQHRFAAFERPSLHPHCCFASLFDPQAFPKSYTHTASSENWCKSSPNDRVLVDHPRQKPLCVALRGVAWTLPAMFCGGVRGCGPVVSSTALYLCGCLCSLSALGESPRLINGLRLYLLLDRWLAPRASFTAMTSVYQPERTGPHSPPATLNS